MHILSRMFLLLPLVACCSDKSHNLYYSPNVIWVIKIKIIFVEKLGTEQIRRMLATIYFKTIHLHLSKKLKD